jgi:MYXO-CTERM domain-containing protein
VNPIRALVFAPAAPAPVTVQIGAGAPVNMTQVNGPLWTAAVDTSAVAAGQQTVKVTATAGGKTRTDTVAVNFVAGPCTPYQDDAGVPPQDAGGPTDGGVEGGTGDDGGEAQHDGGGDAGGPAPADGCGCRVGGVGGGAGWLGLLGVAGLALLARGRGRRRDR